MTLKRNRKVMLTLSEDLYYKIQKLAEQDNIPVATYIKIHLAKLVKED